MLDFTTSSSIIILAFLLPLYFLSPKRTADRPPRPPLCSFYIPIIGHAISFGSAPIDFIQRAVKKTNSPTFRANIAGNSTIFVTTPNSLSKIFSNSKQLSFAPVATEVVNKAFAGYEYIFIPPEPLHRIFVQHLQTSSSLSKSSHVAQTQLKLSLPPPNTTVNLYTFVSKALFRASMFSQIEETISLDDKAFDAFRDFDEAFPLLAAGVPNIFFPKAVAARTYLGNCFSSSTTYKPAPLINARDEVIRFAIGEAKRPSIQVPIVWAVLANTAPAAFWTLHNLLKHPAALAKIKAE